MKDMKLRSKHFDPTQYGMAARYDAEGNFIYPEGFDPDTQEWKPGHDAQREEWERQYQEAQTRFLAHKKQKAEAKAADAAAPEVTESVEVAAE
jgi:small subunit ribosomal protein S1